MVTYCSSTISNIDGLGGMQIRLAVKNSNDPPINTHKKIFDALEQEKQSKKKPA